MNIQRDDVGIVPYGDKLYTVANNYICRDRLPDGPCKINHKRTVEDACPYGGIIVYVTYKLQFEYPDCTAEENFRRLLLGGTTVYEGTPSDAE